MASSRRNKRRSQTAPAETASAPPALEAELVSDDELAPQEAKPVSRQRREPGLKVEMRSERFSGPIPPPAILRDYEAVCPGAAQTILDAFVEQGKHRKELEREVVFGNSRRSWAGLILGFIIALLMLGAGMWCIANHHEVAGTTIIATGMATIAGVFVYGTHSQRAERERKAEKIPDRGEDK